MRRFALVPAFLLAAFSAIAQTGYVTQTYTVPQNTQILSADLSSSGRPDLLLYGGTTVPHILVNDTHGGFYAPVALPGNVVMTHAQIGSFQDNNLPSIAACVVIPGQSQTYLAVYFNDGRGSAGLPDSFTMVQMLPVPACSSVTLADVNGDGRSDIIVAGNSGTATAPNNFVQTFFTARGTDEFFSSSTQANINLNGSSGSTACGLTDARSIPVRTADSVTALLADAQCANGGTTFLGQADVSGHFSFTEQREGPDALTAQALIPGPQPPTPNVVFTGASPTAANLYYAEYAGGSFTFSNLNSSIGSGLNPVQFGAAREGNFATNDSPAFAVSYAAQPNGSSSQFSDISILTGSGGSSFAEQQHWTIGTRQAAGILDLNTNQFSNVNGYSDIVALTYNQFNGATTLYYFKSNIIAGAQACNTPQTAYTVNLCTPASGSISTVPVTVRAASNIPDFTLSRIYVDNQAVYETTSPVVNTSVAVGDGTTAGAHYLAVVSYDSQGHAYVSGNRFTTVPGGICLPYSVGVAICQPGPSTSAGNGNSPITITAGALAQSGNITAIRAYVDNIAVLTSYNPAVAKSFQISESVPVQPGNHQLVIVAYQSTGSALTQTVSFGVTTAPACYPPTTGAAICSPIGDFPFPSPIYVSAGATAGTGNLAVIRVYVDGISQATVFNPQASKSFAVNQPLPITSTGTHTLTIVGYQSTGGVVTATKQITIQ